MIELAKRAVACKHWRWMPRMVDTTGRTFIEHADCGEAVWLWVADDGCEWLPIEGRLPAFTDSATLGCLLALVREGWNQPHAAAAMGDFGWNVYTFVTVAGLIGEEPAITGRYGDGYATETEALIAALEAAPEVSDE